MKIDFHVHSIHSPDSVNNMWLLNKVCKKNGITPVISDHNRISYSREYKKRYNNSIVAEEIHTTSGEVICLFANELIRHNLSIEETLDKIKEQGALVYIPHPFDRLRNTAMKKISFKPDIIEVFNSRTIDRRSNDLALEYAERNKILKGVGSDAHLPYEIGNSYAEMEEFNSVKEFKKNLRNARLVTNRSPVIGFPISSAVYYFRTSLSLGTRIR
ncbi:MAG: PHP domain-containing protein [archaeon]